MAGEIGHMIMEGEGRLNTSTGVRGIAEEYAGARGLTSYVKSELQQGGAGEHSSLTALPVDAVDAKAVFDHAKAGDSFALQVIDDVADVIGRLCINICRVVDPKTIVITGGLTLAGDYLFDKIRAAFAAHHWNIHEIRQNIVPAVCSNAAGAIGAACAAKNRISRS